MLTGTNSIRGRLSVHKMFLSYPVVIRNGVISEIHPLDCILTTTFPMMFIVSLVSRNLVLKFSCRRDEFLAVGLSISAYVVHSVLRSLLD